MNGWQLTVSPTNVIKHVLLAVAQSRSHPGAWAMSHMSRDESPNESNDKSPDGSCDESPDELCDESPCASCDESPDASRNESPDKNHVMSHMIVTLWVTSAPCPYLQVNDQSEGDRWHALERCSSWSEKFPAGKEKGERTMCNLKGALAGS